MAKDIPMYLHGDVLRIKQVIINIMNNAVKYTDKGQITLGVGWEKADKESIMLIFEIRDTGRGIKKKDIERIFSPFERAEEQRNHTIEGNGLGLAITRKLVRLMGGEISVRSEFGKGSVFEVQILQRIVHEKNGENVLKLQNREKHEDTHISAPDAKILVVDDVEANRYDLVLLDHMMPGMDGIETLKLIRKMENSPNKDTPVIAMTANAVLGAKSMYLSEGFDDYISKPIGYIELENLIKRYVDCKRA